MNHQTLMNSEQPVMPDTYTDAKLHARARGYSAEYAAGYAIGYIDPEEAYAYANGVRDGAVDRIAGRPLDPHGERVIHTDAPNDNGEAVS